MRCNDILGARGTLWMVSCMGGLQRLHLEGLQTHFDPTALGSLGALTALEELSLTCDELELHYVAGQRLLRLPASWAKLKKARQLDNLDPKSWAAGRSRGMGDESCGPGRLEREGRAGRGRPRKPLIPET